MRNIAALGEDEPSIGKRPSKAVRVARTNTGWGVFAGRRYQSSEIVGEIGGEVIDDADYTSDYCMDMGDDRCLEPSAPFRFVNHSCEPNCRFKWFDVTAQGEPSPRRRVFLLALLEIEKGQQFTIDYRWPPAMAIPCRCGEATCRGWIVAEEDLQQLLLDVDRDRQQAVAERQLVALGRSQPVALSKT